MVAEDHGCAGSWLRCSLQNGEVCVAQSSRLPTKGLMFHSALPSSPNVVLWAPPIHTHLFKKGFLYTKHKARYCKKSEGRDTNCEIVLEGAYSCSAQPWWCAWINTLSETLESISVAEEEKVLGPCQATFQNHPLIVTRKARYPGELGIPHGHKNREDCCC